MKKFNHLVNVIDVEATCWEPPEVKPADETSDIIEIGIAVVDIKKLIIVANDAIIIKPQHSRVSKFCTQLTTLTQEYVDQGTTFASAIEILKRDFDCSNRTFLSWGDYDRKMFERNCNDYAVKYPFGPRHLNLKNCFTILHGLDSEPGMDKAIEHIGAKLEGTHHVGKDDSKNIANIFLHDLISKEANGFSRWRNCRSCNLFCFCMSIF